jgi:hypothetical protein
MKIYKSKDFEEEEKLGIGKENQLSVALPKWMKDKIRNESQDNKQSMSRYVINLFKNQWKEKE